MEHSVQAHVDLTVDDLLLYLKDTRPKRRGKLVLNYFSALIFGLLGIGLILLGAFQDSGFAFMTIICAMVVAILVTEEWRSRLNIRRKFKQSSAQLTPYDMTIDDEGLREKGPISDVRISWPAITSAEESEHAFALILTTKQQMIVPKRVFSASQLADIRQIIRQHVPGASIGK